jgi:hypothetical protein
MTARGAPRLSPLALLSLVFALLLGSFMVAKRTSAQTPPAGKPAANTVASARPAASAAPEADDKKDNKKDDKKKGGKDDDRTKPDGWEDPLDTATVGPEGGVPVHKDGHYRSPFANPGFGKPAEVKVGFLLSHVRKYDIKEGTFEADFFVSFTSDKPMPPLDPDFTNGKAEKEVLAEKPTFKLYRFVGEFSSPPDLHLYPFDTQALTIEMEDDHNGTDQIRFVADKDHTNLDVGFGVTGWDVAYLQARVLDHFFPDRFAHDDLYHSRYKVTLGVTRYGTSAAFTVFVPAFVIVLISLSGLWLPRPELEVRSNASAPMLAAAVLFHFTLTQALPPTPYLTRADKLMLGVYLSLLLNMLATWAWFVFDEKHEHQIFLIGRRFVPPLTFALMAAGSLL